MLASFEISDLRSGISELANSRKGTVQLPPGSGARRELDESWPALGSET
jgi:hypothetical protein